LRRFWLNGSAKECSAEFWGEDRCLIYSFAEHSSADNSSFSFPLHPCFGCGCRAGALREKFRNEGFGCGLAVLGSLALSWPFPWFRAWLTIATAGLYKNGLPKMIRFGRKTGVPAKKNDIFANTFSLFHGSFFGKPLPARNFLRAGR
jgi:hypothetical protein